jgi:ribosomal protein S18 acetylase RimI-like enzyme
MKFTQLKVQIDTPKPGELYVFAHEADEAAPIGMLRIGLEEKKTGWVSGVFVQESARGKGVGRKLVKRAIALCREMNMEFVSLAVADKNKAAQALYKSLGFKVFMAGQKGYMQYVKTL